MTARILALAFALLALPAAAERVIRTPADFVAAQFGGEAPASRSVWLTGELKSQATDILGHPPSSLRLRYWHRDSTSVWVLDEIGKEQPITAGFAIDQGQLRQAEVLIYREGRGGEIELPGFLRQFTGAELDDGKHLDRHIDNITGATLSVRAMQRMARLALHLHRQVVDG